MSSSKKGEAQLVEKQTNTIIRQFAEYVVFFVCFCLFFASPMLAVEKSYQIKILIEFCLAHFEIPIVLIGLYLVLVFAIPSTISGKGFNLRHMWAYWNLFLSFFSIIGVSRTVPTLIGAVQTHGLQYSMCHPAQEWFLGPAPNAAGFWVALFIFSKVPELIDTVFLVLQKKPVIFLHWFHHVTVLFYCWYAFANWTSAGLWFAAMNYSVHSMMYFYYFLSISGYRRLTKPVAPLVTVIQITQMAVGSAVTIATTIYKYQGVPCGVTVTTCYLGCAMYLSYLVLFAILFYNLYLNPEGKHARKPNKVAADKQKSS